LLCCLAPVAARGQGLYADRSIPATERVDRLRIYKARHRLEAWSGKRLLKVYKVAIGRGGAGHKRQEGDGKTPEGSYVIDAKRHSRTFHRFLHVSYPNAKDRAAFARARRAGTLPAKATIGGAIGVHGEKRGWAWLPHKWVDWTQGCIAVDNEEIEELYPVVQLKAVVEIYP
jgi:murein L,D-transpeptidase YafK